MNQSIYHRSDFQFASVGLGLIGLHLMLSWLITHHTDQFVLNLLFWYAIASSLWQRRAELNQRCDRHSCWLGLGLLSCIISSLISYPLSSAWVRVLPGPLVCCILLIFSLSFRQSRSELLLSVMLMLPQGQLSLWVQQDIGLTIQTAIAQCATFFLHYIGINVVRQGTEMITPQGSVEVQYGCAGIPVLIILVQLSVLMILSYQLSVSRSITLLLAAVSIAFIVSSSRVALMTLVVDQETLFSYWHGATGAQFFSTLAIILLSFCSYCIKPHSS